MSDFYSMIPWYKLRKHLEARLAEINSKWPRAKTDQELWQLQGRAQQLGELLGIPDTLTNLEEDEEREKKETTQTPSLQA